MRIWSQALELAAATPPERNRYVDFLRAVSILFVVVGHWLIATLYYVDGDLTPGQLLESRPQMHWVTWIFQVMPIFFIVGGYSNAVSLESARRKSVGYATWLAARLHRLVAPLLIVLVAWAAFAVVLNVADVPGETIRFVSSASLIPNPHLVSRDLHHDRDPGTAGLSTLAARRLPVILDVRGAGGSYRPCFFRGRPGVAGLDQLLLGVACCPPAGFRVA
jgi:hypothetical protein